MLLYVERSVRKDSVPRGRIRRLDYESTLIGEYTNKMYNSNLPQDFHILTQRENRRWISMIPGLWLSKQENSLNILVEKTGNTCKVDII